ncbi:MAG: hypothetical protein HY518_05565 [Candidatus Aenigmarchaeota archaeon]|nr:hypothetical protein [Candidatus Aenigmarchaeota archaeon]
MTEVELAALAIVVAAIVGSVSILVTFSLLQSLVEINARVELTVAQEDAGSGIVALMASRAGQRAHAEIIGMLEIAEVNDAAVTQTLGKMGRSLQVYDDNGTAVKEYGDFSGGEYTDIALPGGRKGRAGIS